MPTNVERGPSHDPDLGPAAIPEQPTPLADDEDADDVPTAPETRVSRPRAFVIKNIEAQKPVAPQPTESAPKPAERRGAAFGLSGTTGVSEGLLNIADARDGTDARPEKKSIDSGAAVDTETEPPAAELPSLPDLAGMLADKYRVPSASVQEKRVILDSAFAAPTPLKDEPKKLGFFGRWAKRTFSALSLFGIGMHLHGEGEQSVQVPVAHEVDDAAPGPTNIVLKESSKKIASKALPVDAAEAADDIALVPPVMVKRGDSFTSLAKDRLRKDGTPLTGENVISLRDKIAADNDMTLDTVIHPGQRLIVDPSYTEPAASSEQAGSTTPSEIELPLPEDTSQMTTAELVAHYSAVARAAADEQADGEEPRSSVASELTRHELGNKTIAQLAWELLEEAGVKPTNPRVQLIKWIILDDKHWTEARAMKAKREDTVDLTRATSVVQQLANDLRTGVPVSPQQMAIDAGMPSRRIKNVFSRPSPRPKE